VKAQVTPVAPEQKSPVQPEKSYEAAGLAVSVTEPPTLNTFEHVAPQLMPVPDTEPPEVGEFETVSVTHVIAVAEFEVFESNLMPVRGSVKNDFTV